MARGWIEKAFIDDRKTRIKFGAMNREIIQTITQQTFGRKTRETIFYRNGAKYFISVDGTPVETSFSKMDCAKKAFLNGHISADDYVSFTRGPAASAR